ncbi:hypothetical protein D9M68_654480 [compost metagenome]
MNRGCPLETKAPSSTNIFSRLPLTCGRISTSTVPWIEAGYSESVVAFSLWMAYTGNVGAGAAACCAALSEHPISTTASTRLVRIIFFIFF